MCPSPSLAKPPPTPRTIVSGPVPSRSNPRPANTCPSSFPARRFASRRQVRRGRCRQLLVASISRGQPAFPAAQCRVSRHLVHFPCQSLRRNAPSASPRVVLVPRFHANTTSKTILLFTRCQKSGGTLWGESGLCPDATLRHDAAHLFRK
ncbi:hypothetical protein TRVL_09007 [Trypanosoma vivax]|nr:hypothetical protein TRVL_09007 [Trypanosoma vivax]